MTITTITGLFISIALIIFLLMYQSNKALKYEWTCVKCYLNKMQYAEIIYIVLFCFLILPSVVCFWLLLTFTAPSVNTQSAVIYR